MIGGIFVQVEPLVQPWRTVAGYVECQKSLDVRSVRDFLVPKIVQIEAIGNDVLVAVEYLGNWLRWRVGGCWKSKLRRLDLSFRHFDWECSNVLSPNETSTNPTNPKPIR